MLAVQERNGWLEETVSFHNCAEFLFPIRSKWNSWLVCGLQQVHKHVHFLKISPDETKDLMIDKTVSI